MKRWYREFWPWALMVPPALAVAGGVTMLVLAIRTPGSLAVADYARIEELTSERFALDSEAARLGLAASVRFGNDRIELTLAGATDGAQPDALILTLQHATDAAQDRVVPLMRAGGLYSAAAAIAPGRYRLELVPADHRWRLASPVLYPVGQVELRPQAAGG